MPATPDLAAFESAAADWFARNGLPSGSAPSRSREAEAYVAAARRQQHALFDAGFAGISWPAEFGGRGLEVAYEHAFHRAASGYETFADVFTIGLGMCGPVLLALGTEEQKRRYIPPMLRGEELWCQLFSEPGAGSDLAGLTTAARAEADGFAVSGQKVWNTYAHHSDFGLLIARTDPEAPKHRGITMFIADMHAEGITVRPLKQATGDTEFNEVFLDSVRVPADRIVGTVDEGWRAATLMLMNERKALGHDANPLNSPVTLDAVLGLIRERGLAGDPVLRRRVAEIYVLQRSVDLFAKRIAGQVDVGQDPGPVASAGKLATGRLAKAVAALAMDVAGPDAVAWDPDQATDGGRWAYAVLYAPSLSIAGGTDQIQRTIIGERVLGLPREPGEDRTTPFRQLRTSAN